VEEVVVADAETVVVRGHTTATHVGAFMGIPATERRVQWDWITMVQVRGGRVVGQWAQPDLFAIYRQITGLEIEAAPPDAHITAAAAWASPVVVPPRDD